jgi:hypothetical protein
MFQKLLNYIEHIPAHDYKTFVLFLGASGVVSVVLQMIKPFLKRLEARYGMDAEKLTASLLGLLSFTMSTAQNLIAANPSSLGVVLGSHTAEIMALAYLLYHIKLSDGYAWLTQALTDVHTYLVTGKLPEGAFKPKS